MSRFIKGNKGTETPSNWLFVDTESYVSNPDEDAPSRLYSLRNWCAIAVRTGRGRVLSRTVHRGETAAEFWALAAGRELPRSPLWVVAHNVGHDLAQLRFWDALERGDYTVGPVVPGPGETRVRGKQPWRGLLVLSSRPSYLKLLGKVGRVNVVDSCNYWPVPLAEMAAAVGRKKPPLPAWEADQAEWDARCYADAEILERSVLGLVNRWVTADCGVFQMTAASLSLTSWRHRKGQAAADDQETGVVVEGDPERNRLERRAFYGGWTDPFFVGKIRQRVHMLDCNSLYPFVMASNRFPCKRQREFGAQPVDQLRRWLCAYQATAHVTLNSRINTYPVRMEGQILHCNGQFTTWLAGEDLKRAVFDGDVAKVHGGLLYTVADLFSEWVAEWWERKSAALKAGGRESADYLFCKLILNSLYGKFAQRGERWEERSDVCPQVEYGEWLDSRPGPEPDTMELRRFRAIGRVVQERVIGADASHVFPAISAAVTAAGREWMRLMVRDAGAGHVYYVATDALLVDDAGLRNLKRAGRVDAERLGALSIRGDWPSAEIRGVNNYTLGTLDIRAGWWGRSRRTDAGVWVADLWETLPQTISRKPDGTTSRVTRALAEERPRERGIVGADGWVTPLRLSPEAEFGDRPAPPRPRILPLGSTPRKPSAVS